MSIIHVTSFESKRHFRKKILKMSYVKRNYTNPKLSGAYSGLKGFVKNRKVKDKQAAETKLQELEPFTLHKDVKLKFPRRRIVVPYINHTWAGDLKI